MSEVNFTLLSGVDGFVCIIDAPGAGHGKP